MIGVVFQSIYRAIAAEFFELFKTPWEFYRSEQRYDVVICTQEDPIDGAGELVLFYSAEVVRFDTRNRVPAKSRRGGTTVSYEGKRIPIYGHGATFPADPISALRDEASQESVVFRTDTDGRTTVRIGYDLFQEVRFLLSVGQPAAHAGTAALELHITLLRDLITRSGFPLVEIPPVPDGYSFIACLTHDLDHPVLRNHWLDHTMFGFLYRASVGALVDFCRRRKPIKNLCANWAAVCRLPFVYLGIAKDFWREFDRYLEIEAGLGATFFVIPRKDYPGRRANGNRAARRASRYDVADIKPQLGKIISSGCEVGLHGIHAWLDADGGREESKRVSEVTGATQVGVRMHWLFFDERSPAVLDRAGFSYDSTVGYNETVGYRAGNAQAYKPAGSAILLELPLHVMDTALFYPNHLNLTNEGAEKVVWRLIDDMVRFGGAMTINWHDRSIAPERL